MLWSHRSARSPSLWYGHNLSSFYYQFLSIKISCKLNHLPPTLIQIGVGTEYIGFIYLVGLLVVSSDLGVSPSDASNNNALTAINEPLEIVPEDGELTLVMARAASLLDSLKSTCLGLSNPQNLCYTNSILQLLVFLGF